MRKGYYFIIFLHLLSCDLTKSNSQNHGIVVLEIDEEEVFISEIDSIIGYNIHELRKRAVELVIDKKLIDKEAINRKTTTEELINNEIVENCRKITNDEHSYRVCLQDKKRWFIDSLKQFHSINRTLKPPFFQRINTDSIFYFNLNSEDKSVAVYIISDFACPACRKAETKLAELQEKYDGSVSFRFVYFSDYFTKSAHACEAANNIGKFKQMHDMLFRLPNEDLDVSGYLGLARKVGLDKGAFLQTMSDKTVLLNFLKNKDILTDMGIYSTPTFIVNGKVLNDSYSINYLETVIMDELLKL